MNTEETWKKSEVVIPQRDENPPTNESSDPLLSPITGDASGGLDSIGQDLTEVVKSKDKSNIDLAKAVNILKFEGKEDHIEKFKHVASTQFEENSMGSVMTPSGVPVGLIYSFVGEAQKRWKDLDLTSDKIVVHVKLRNNCKKCGGRGYIGRLANPVTREFTNKLLQCICLKLKLDIEKGESEEKDDADPNSKQE